MYEYKKYYLTDNPFPSYAVIDPQSPDPRINGTIFLEDIFPNEIRDLQEKTDLKRKMVYISGTQQDKGVGKSALLIHHWRKCLNIGNSSSVYIKIEEGDKTKDICRKIINEWHNNGTIWRTFQSLFLKYCESQSNPLLRKDSVNFLFEEYPNLCESLPFTLYTRIRNSESIASTFISFLEEQTRFNLQNITDLFNHYLTEPKKYTQIIEKSSDTVSIFECLIKIFDLDGLTYHHLFLDQFEDLIAISSKSKIRQLSLELRKILLAGSRRTSFYVTLHPGSEMLLTGNAANDLTGIAPLDNKHRVDVMMLDRHGTQAVLLVKAYMDYYRTENPPYPTYPIQEKLINFLNYLEEGNIRAILQSLYQCIEYACYQELDEITFDYALHHPEDILGREPRQKQIDNFLENQQ